MHTVGFTSSNWTWGPTGRTQRCVGASLYYRGALAAAQFAARGAGGIVAERCRTSTKGSGEMEIYGQDFAWHTPDVVWTEFLGCTEEDLFATRRARAAGQIIIGDLDDDVWQLPSTNDAHKVWNSDDRPLYFEQLAACNAIICSTEDLAYKAQRLGPPVFLIRNAVDCDWIRPHDPADKAVSWIGSTPWRAHDLSVLKAAGLSSWLDDHDETFYHGGHMDPPAVPDIAKAAIPGVHWKRSASLAEQAGLRGDQVVWRPNVPFVEYPGLWDDVGVSLVPLEDCPFNRAKSWLKSLESCAAGVPYVVSAGFPEQLALIEQGTMGWVVRNDRPKEWTRVLDNLRDPDVRRAQGRVNRTVALANDIRVRWIEWLAVFEEVAGFRLVRRNEPDVPSDCSLPA